MWFELVKRCIIHAYQHFCSNFFSFVAGDLYGPFFFTAR